MTRRSIYAVVAMLLCVATSLLGQRAPEAPQGLRVRLVHADLAAHVDPLDILRALAAVTYEVAAPHAKAAVLAEGDRLVQGRVDSGALFTIQLVERSKDATVVEWLSGHNVPDALDQSEAAKVVDRVKQLVAERGQVPAEARRAEIEELRRQREALRGKQSILEALVRGQAKTRREGLDARLARLDAEREALEIDLAAAEARTEALRDQMVRLQREAEQKAANDPIQDQLKHLLKLRQEELKRARELHAQGGVGTGEVSAVEGRVAEAEVQVLMRREQVMRGDEKGELLGRMASELATIEIDRAEKEARLNYVLQRLPQLDPKALDEKALDGIAEKYPTLVGADGDLPPLYYELHKRHEELLKKELGLLVSEVKVESDATTAPAP